MKRATLTALFALLPIWGSAAPEATAAPRYKHLSRPRSAQCQDPAQLEAAVRTLLEGYEPLDVGHGMAELGAPAADVLLRLIQARAHRSLCVCARSKRWSYVPTPAGQAYLRETVAKIGTVDDERVFTFGGRAARPRWLWRQ